ncbi:MAG: bifunctional diaminohydroxyphosphoribosylaminopyrimidine deaminase/5-amino-6-(5-phosphoribosylamino)uracil reductase RibD [Prevotellaceae bacterium]|jgi:diaminohydroxyphosphoribosylaminopyrimidine deaminase/5-amino-6-(5-phosphoribosylamino)uracil reductase|nr:bifunctional diaminohydroxyphosphoribosylaminopyrimidine deaminase/5-amino-6-(5-phosphoribosylamino)uracil reductase RibD [Prevotellaceae bacterium]
MEDSLYMSRCLTLAALGEGYVAPNPMVGALLMCNGQIIGEGYHRAYGGVHAEPNAINSVTDKSMLCKSTLYVTLEPCSHFGKTPPCAELIVRCGIPKVVIGTEDPNPKVAGKGIKILQNAGIEVVTGVLKDECYDLNKRFFTFIEKKRPFIVLKWAQTADGFLDIERKNCAQKPLQISNRLTKILTHKVRTENQAIMVGTNTVLLDNPKLTARHWQGKAPVRLILDPKGRIPDTFNVMDGSEPTFVFTEKENKTNRKNCEFIYFDFSKKNITHLVTEIYNLNIHSVLVEGGAKLLTSFINEQLWDDAQIEISPIQTGKGVKAPFLPLALLGEKEYEKNRILFYKNAISG